MKKTLHLLIIFFICFLMFGCRDNRGIKNSNNLGESNQRNIEENESINIKDKKVLVAYFSIAGENYGVGNVVKGNTNIVADMISKELDADSFEIKTVKSYPENYDERTEVVKEEKEKNARPELANSLINIADYDVIFLGYPIWWSDMPMAVYNFLESYDFSNKTIVPFCTHEGSGLSNTVESIAKICPDAKVLVGFEIRGTTAQKSQDETNSKVKEWIKKTINI